MYLSDIHRTFELLHWSQDRPHNKKCAGYVRPSPPHSDADDWTRCYSTGSQGFHRCCSLRIKDNIDRQQVKACPSITPPEMPFFVRRPGHPFYTWFLKPPRVQMPNGISIGLTVLAGLTRTHTHRHTDNHATWVTSCCSIESERPHRCCHLPNKVENIDRTPDILYTLQWTGRCSKIVPSERIRAPSNIWRFDPPESIPQTASRWV